MREDSLVNKKLVAVDGRQTDDHQLSAKINYKFFELFAR
jgi:hypothetical protein